MQQPVTEVCPRWSVINPKYRSVWPSGTHSALVVRVRAPCGPSVTRLLHLGPSIGLLDYVFVTLGPRPMRFLTGAK